MSTFLLVCGNGSENAVDEAREEDVAEKVVAHNVGESVDVEGEGVVQVVEEVEDLVHHVSDLPKGGGLGFHHYPAQFVQLFGDEPQQVVIEGCSGLGDDEFLHTGQLHFEDVEGERPHGHPHHAL